MSALPPRPAGVIKGLLPGLLALLAWAGPAVAQAPDAAEMDRAAAIRLSASVLRIEAPRPGGGFSLGSGVMVGPDLVVTNCHVTRDSSRLFVVRGGARWAVKAQLPDVHHDLCLLQTAGSPAPPVPLAETAPGVGQPVLALGFTGGVDLQHSFGQVLRLHPLDGASVVQTSNGFNSGASGGGLFDNQGRLVGVLTFRMAGGEHHYFAAPAPWVRELLDRAQARGLPAVSPLDPAAQPYWLLPGEQQPRFLRASRLAREQRWAELATLCRAWLLDTPQDGEPWRQLAQALAQLAQPDAARQAQDCADRLLAGTATASATQPPDPSPIAANGPPAPGNPTAAAAEPGCPVTT